MEKRIVEEPIVRDAAGWYEHPDLPEFEPGDTASFQAWLDLQGLVVMRVWMESNNPDLAARYSDGEGDPTAMIDWNPTPPKGDGWFLLAIYESDDGPHAYYARRPPPAE